MFRPALLSAGISLGFMAAPPAAATEAFREKRIEIARAAVEHEWPFSVDRGELVCFIFAGRRMVLFSEPNASDPDWFVKGLPYQPSRTVIVSTNPIEIFASLEDADLFLPFDSDFAVLIRRLTPFVAMGQALCDQLLDGEEGD